jgi:hypothetical protein
MLSRSRASGMRGQAPSPPAHAPRPSLRTTSRACSRWPSAAPSSRLPMQALSLYVNVGAVAAQNAKQSIAHVSTADVLCLQVQSVQAQATGRYRGVHGVRRRGSTAPKGPADWPWRIAAAECAAPVRCPKVNRFDSISPIESDTRRSAHIIGRNCGAQTQRRRGAAACDGSMPEKRTQLSTARSGASAQQRRRSTVGDRRAAGVSDAAWHGTGRAWHGHGLAWHGTGRAGLTLRASADRRMKRSNFSTHSAVCSGLIRHTCARQSLS